MKRFIACLLAMVILCSNFCYAIPLLKKKETVYINLESYGEVDEINIYSKCKTNGTTKIEDYTFYSEVTNLTNKELPISESGEIIWNVSGEENFSYTGKVSKEYYNKLPWKFEITYKLNGIETKKEDLLGAKGVVEITLQIDSNENANQYYRNNYILEITASYDMTDYLSVESDEAMITDTGNTKTLMFIVLPGQSTTLSIRLGSEDFSMDGITMAAVPITGDILKEISNLIEGKNDIKDALDSIDKSTDIVLNSLGGMSSGLNGISAGISEIKKGTQEVHNISDLRDEDIENLKSILEESLPIIENTKNDLENLSSHYEEFIEMYEKLDLEVEKLEKNVKNLNEEFEDIVSMSKNLPSDIEDIKDVINNFAKITDDVCLLLKYSDDESTKEQVEKNLTNLVVESKKLEELSTNVEDEQLKMLLESSSQSILLTTSNVKSIFEEVSLAQIKEKDTISKDLTKLKNSLYDIEESLNKNDAKTIRDFISDLSDISYNLESMLSIVIDYNEKILEGENDVLSAIENMKQIVDELSKMNSLSISMIDNIQSILKTLSGSIYNGTQKTMSEMISLNNQLLNITEQSNNFKDSKNKIKNVVEDKFDDIEEKTTLFNVSEDAEVISFGSEKNENVESVQFIYKTPDIKKIKEPEKDLEKESESISFWDRVKLVFQKMFGWIKNIF